MLSVLFVIILGAAHGEVMDSASVFDGPSGQFFVHNNQSIEPETSWTGDIYPPNATNIFIVIEKMILAENDTLNIIASDNKTTLWTMNGTQDPFSALVDGERLRIVIKTSNLNVQRRFIGYYTKLGCTYQINNTFGGGSLSTPLLSLKNDNAVTCNFSLMPLQPETFSILSVNFTQLHLKQGKVQVFINGAHSYDYPDDGILHEIITDKNLKFSFSLHKNDTAKFFYKPVLKESEYLELNTTKQRHKFEYMPAPEKEYYPSGVECHWVTKSEKNTTISFKFSEVSLSGLTRIIFNDGKNWSSNLFQASSSNENILKNRRIYSSENYLWISIVQPVKDTLIMGEVIIHQNGGYRRGDGELNVPSNSTEVVYLLEEEDGKNVVLDQHKGNLTTNSIIHVYSDFSTDSLPIIIYNTSLPHYPIVSSTSQMMVIASNFTNANYKAAFRGIDKGCYEMSTLESGEYSLSGNCNNSCQWIVPPVEDLNNVISLHLHPNMFEVQDVAILSLLDATQTVIAKITSQTNALPEIYLPSSSGLLLNSTRGNCSASNSMLHATFEKRKACNTMQNLKPGSRLSVTSPNFPDSYPFWAHCWTNVTVTNGSKNGHFLLTFNKIDLAATHCLRIRHGTGLSPETIKTYAGSINILPGDLILNDTVSVEFLAQPCNSTKKQPLNLSTSSGFSLEILSADCGGKIETEQGNFSTPDFPKGTTAVICTWILEVPKKDNIINFTVTRNESKDYELEIYDGFSIRNETMKNHSSSSTLLSKTNSLIFVYRQTNSSQTSPGIHVAFHSQVCSTRCMNGLCLHDDWKCNKINDCGDNTDEIDCGTAPIEPTTTVPPPDTHNSGVSPVALGLGIPIAFILGIVAAIYLPPLIRRFRSGQYHQFRDVSADA